MDKEKTAEQKPVKKIVKPERTKVDEIEKIVIELGKKGLSPSKIGMIIKKDYNVDKIKLLGKKITKILKENNIKFDDDLANVNKKIKKISEHYEKNKQDKRAGKEIVRFIGLRKKLEKYNLKKQQ